MDEPKKDSTPSVVPYVPFPSRSVLDGYPDYTKAIGMISVEIGRLELYFADLLAALLHVHPYFGHVLYHTPRANIARLEIVQNVLRGTLPDENNERRVRIEDYLARARAVMGKRHENIHDAWGVSEKDGRTVVRRPLPFKSDKPDRPIPITELTDQIDKIRRLVDEVRIEAARTFQEWPPYTWQGKPPELPADVQNPAGPLPEDTPPAQPPPSGSSQE